MAKTKRTPIGSVCKNKDEKKANYLKINLKSEGSVTLKHGQYLSVESKKFQLESLADAEKAGKLSEELAAKARARIENIPAWVLGEVILTEENDN